MKKNLAMLALTTFLTSAQDIQQSTVNSITNDHLIEMAKTPVCRQDETADRQALIGDIRKSRVAILNSKTLNLKNNKDEYWNKYTSIDLALVANNNQKDTLRYIHYDHSSQPKTQYVKNYGDEATLEEESLTITKKGFKAGRKLPDDVMFIYKSRTPLGMDYDCTESDNNGVTQPLKTIEPKKLPNQNKNVGLKAPSVTLKP